ncbi:MAG: helix-turn-helix domain-containing protein [Candidatus Dormibacteria bacterium]
MSAAAALFNQGGDDGTSLALLAIAAGITKSSVHHHFRGQEDLLSVAMGGAMAEHGPWERPRMAVIGQQSRQLLATRSPPEWAATPGGAKAVLAVARGRPSNDDWRHVHKPHGG